MSRWNRSLGVGVVQRVAEHGDQLAPIRANAGRPRPSRVCQVAAFHVLGDDVATAVVGAADVVDRHDVGVREPREDPGLAQVGLDVEEPRCVAGDAAP